MRRHGGYRIRLRCFPTRTEVIVLAYYGQLSHTEIAARIGVPTGTVKGRIRLGLQKLRADIPQATAL
jgi:RNA polymerase sigma-70 factor (ECF subfamily)